MLIWKLCFWYQMIDIIKLIAFSALNSPVCTSASVFTFILIMFLDTLIQKMFSEIMKINNFHGDLTNSSAKKEALVCTQVSNVLTKSVVVQSLWSPPPYTHTILFRGIIVPCEEHTKIVHNIDWTQWSVKLKKSPGYWCNGQVFCPLWRTWYMDWQYHRPCSGFAGIMFLSI